MVTAGGSGECEVGITDGRISQLGGSPRGRAEIDASGALVLPGGNAARARELTEMLKPLHLPVTIASC